MDNPFSFTGIVDRPAFCDREKELRELAEYVENSQNVLLYSHRRYGKSSLILQLFKKIKKVTPVYIDLYGTTSVEGLISAFLKGISSLESQMNRLMKLVGEQIRSIRVNFSVDPLSGLPTASPVFDRTAEDKTVEETFALVERLSRRKRLVVAFDEFQETAAYGGTSFEKLLRSIIQKHDRIAYIFCGSQKHILTEMFSNRKRAFYMLAARYPLHKIETTHYVKWISGLYRKAERKIDPLFIEEAVRRCENHPMYVQEFFFNAWTEPGLSFEALGRIERDIVAKRIPELSYAWDALTINQRRALKLIAGTEGKNVFSAENMARFNFRTASQVTTALRKLEKSGIVEKNNEWRIYDPYLKKWLVMSQSA